MKRSRSPCSPSPAKRTQTRRGRKSKPHNRRAKAFENVSKVGNAPVLNASSPLPSSRAIVVRQPSWIGSATLARHATSAPAVCWLEGWHGYLQRGVVNLLTGLSGQGKSSVAGSMAAHQSKAGKHVLIYRSAEDSISKWNQRIELMGGNLDHVAYADNPAQVWSILESADPPAFLIFDPLQQFLGIGVNNGAAARASMNRLTELAAQHSMVMLGVIHWKEYANKLMGSGEIRNIARVILKPNFDGCSANSTCSPGAKH
jgi:AAA domain-containing protein